MYLNPDLAYEERSPDELPVKRSYVRETDRLAVLGLDEEVEDKLTRFGVKTAGHLVRTPAGTLQNLGVLCHVLHKLEEAGLSLAH